MSKELELGVASRSRMGKDPLLGKSRFGGLGDYLEAVGLGQDGGNPGPETGEENLGLSPFAAPVGRVPEAG